MVNFSRFTHKFDLIDAVALYHSLRMKPIFLKKDILYLLDNWIANKPLNLDSVPTELKDTVSTLLKYKILTSIEDEDSKVLSFIKSKVPKPSINVCYMIISEMCNLACKYCFVGNNNKNIREKYFHGNNMSQIIADKAISFFLRQLELSQIGCSEINKPVIIFYGGEPLINFPILVYIAETINNLRSSNIYLKDAELSLITNGTLLDKEKILKLKDLGVSIAISVDGFTEEDNSMRVDSKGNIIFNKLLSSIDLCKQLEVDVSLSVTLTENTIKNTKNILDLLDRYNISAFGFNIMMSNEDFVLSDDYNEKAAQFIIDEFLELRKRGIYEDRIIRKLKSFSTSQIYFSDCAATAGGQIVISPDGQVGICHGCLADKSYFITNVFDNEFNACKNEIFLEWSQITPINQKLCLDCPALGICGGGCPINARNLRKGNTIHSIDERFCHHSKKTLEFFIKDLYNIIKNSSRKDDE